MLHFSSIGWECKSPRVGHRAEYICMPAQHGFALTRNTHPFFTHIQTFHFSCRDYLLLQAATVIEAFCDGGPAKALCPLSWYDFPMLHSLSNSMELRQISESVRFLYQLYRLVWS